MVGKEGEGPAIGIDLGTTYSCVGVWQHEKVEIIVNGQGNRTTPSYVAFTEEESLVGDGAKNQIGRNPTSTIFDVKRLIGRRFSDPIVQNDIKLWPFKVFSGDGEKPMISVQYKGEEKHFTAEQISSMVLAYMRHIAVVYLGTTVKNAVVTVPAYFNNSQRQATKDAGVAAGLNIMRVVNEPTAAAIAYFMNEKDRGHGNKNVLIFDLGGGTFDVSVLQINGRDLKVIATAGDSHLGGVDFDNRLVNHCVQEFKRIHNKDMSHDHRALRKLRAACERAKIALSFAFETAIDLEYLHGGNDFQCTITSAKFEQLNMDLFKKCIEVVDQCLKNAKVEKDDVHEVVLVGGSTRIPKVQELLCKLLNKSKICKTVHPDEVVACGAAIHAAMLGGEGCLRFEDIVFQDVTPLPLGIGIVGGLMSVLIPKNTPIPVKREKIFTTSFDNQDKIRFTVFEGERAIARENNLLGEFELCGIAPFPKLVPQIPVWFEIDANGILVVSAEELATKGKAKITIAKEEGWPRRETSNTVVLEAEKEKLEKEITGKVDARIRFENYVYEVRESIRLSETASSADKEMMGEAIEKALAWLQSHQSAEVEEYDWKRTDLETTWSIVMSRDSQEVVVNVQKTRGRKEQVKDEQKNREREGAAVIAQEKKRRGCGLWDLCMCWAKKGTKETMNGQ